MIWTQENMPAMAILLPKRLVPHTSNSRSSGLMKFLCWIFYADFTKGFDIIDHNIPLNELNSLRIDQTLCFWIRAFITKRTQTYVSVRPCHPGAFTWRWSTGENDILKHDY